MKISDFENLINGFTDGGSNTASELRTMLTAIKNCCLIPNEIKWIKLSPSDYSSYFDSTGLGLDIYDGWAVCNGNNETTNDDGLVSVAYGATYNSLGDVDGSKDSVLISHTHTVVAYKATEAVIPSGGSGQNGSNQTLTTSSPIVGSGVTVSADGVGKNMQPYVVELKIQRIA